MPASSLNRGRDRIRLRKEGRWHKFLKARQDFVSKGMTSSEAHRAALKSFRPMDTSPVASTGIMHLHEHRDDEASVGPTYRALTEAELDELRWTQINSLMGLLKLKRGVARPEATAAILAEFKFRGWTEEGGHPLLAEKVKRDPTALPEPEECPDVPDMEHSTPESDEGVEVPERLDPPLESPEEAPAGKAAASELEVIRWVATQISNKHMRQKRALSTMAWALLLWARQNEDDFWKGMWVKTLPSRSVLEKQAMLIDDGRDVMSMLDRLEQVSLEEVG